MSRFVHPAAISEIVDPIPGGAVLIWAEADTWSWDDLGDFFGKLQGAGYRPPDPDDLLDGQEILEGRYDRWIWTHPSDADAEQIDAQREWLKDILAERILPACTVGVEVRLGGSRGKLVLGTAYLGLCEIDLHKDVDEQIREFANDNDLIDEALNEAYEAIDARIEELEALRTHLTVEVSEG